MGAAGFGRETTEETKMKIRKRKESMVALVTEAERGQKRSAPGE